MRWLGRFVRRERGASMVEFSIVAVVLMLLVGGAIDFSFAFFQWNAATKAVQQGIRIASVSKPVAAGFERWTYPSLVPGASLPNFTITCQATSPSAGTCNCSGTLDGACPVYDVAAMNRIVNGRDNVCGQPEPTSLPGMCDVFWRIQPQNVIVTYSQGTSLGFAGRPGGPVPTITVELTGLQFDFIFLRGFIGRNFATMPAMRSSATGEDLRSCWPPAPTC